MQQVLLVNDLHIRMDGRAAAGHIPQIQGAVILARFDCSGFDAQCGEIPCVGLRQLFVGQ
ncbi:hypothetical protein D3C73_1400380 [compost metagenome]